MTKIFLSMLALFCASFTHYAEAAVAGHFQFVAGDVRVIAADGKVRFARKGAEVSEGESISTNATSSAQIRMVDEGLIVVRPDTRLKVTTFVFNGKADGTERSLFSLVKGGFRAITGIIGRVNKEHYKIETPTATIGIRGTDHEPTFIPNPPRGKVAIAEPGTYDKVNSGAAVLSTANGMVVINPNQAGFVPNIPNAAPTVLAVIPAFYKVDQGKDEPQILPGARLKEDGGASSLQSSTVKKEIETPGIKKGAENSPSKAGVLESGGTAKSLSGTIINPTTKSGATLTPLNTGTATTPIVTGTSSTTLKQPSLNTLTPVTTIAPATTVTKTLSTTITPIVAPVVAPTITSATKTLTTTISPIIAPTVAPAVISIIPIVAPSPILVEPVVVSPTITTTTKTLTTTITPIIAPTLTTIAPAPTPITTTIIVAPTTTIQPTTKTISPTLIYSDRRLKQNIKRVGTHPLGIGIYEFDYVWGEHATGVMADEVKQVLPEAVIRDASGYDKVDYSKLN